MRSPLVNLAPIYEDQLPLESDGLFTSYPYVIILIFTTNRHLKPDCCLSPKQSMYRVENILALADKK